MKHYTHTYNSHTEEKKNLCERVLQKVTINGKELKDKDIEVTLREDQVNFNPKTKAGQFQTSINITISDDGDKKKKKEEGLKIWKNAMKKELLFTIGRLLKEIALVAQEMEIQSFIKREVLFPLTTEKTYGITVDKEKHQALMINSLFDYFEEIDNLKGKDIPKVRKILKKVTDNIKGFAEKREEGITYHFGTPPKEKSVPETKEDFKYKCEVKARQMGKTQEMKDYIFAGVDFGKGPGDTHCFNVGIRNGKSYIEEI